MSADKRTARERLGRHSRVTCEAELLRRSAVAVVSAGRLRKIAAGLPWWRVLGRWTISSEARWYQREGEELLAAVERLRGREAA